MGNRQTEAGAMEIEQTAARGSETGEAPDDSTVFTSYKAKKSAPGEETAKTKPRPRPKQLTAEAEVDPKEEAFAETPLEEPSVKKTNKPMAKKIAPTAADKKESAWLNGEGQLTVDVYQTENDLVVQSAIAGIKVEDLDVLIEDDMITVKGNRPNPLQEKGDYVVEECYWGPFSRKIILPVEVDSSRADAAMKDGILTIRIPKIQREKKKKVIVKE